MRSDTRGIASLGLAMVFGMSSGCYAGVTSWTTAGSDEDPQDDAGDEPGHDGDDPETPDEPASQCGGTASPGISHLRRLSGWEYDNTIEDLLGDDRRPSSSFPKEGGGGFDNNADVATITALTTQRYMIVSEELSADAVQDLDALMPCDPQADEAACVERWIGEFGRRAWRRPLLSSEQAAMLALFEDRRDQRPLPDALATVLQAFLQSPHFLYRVELGLPDESGNDVVRLTSYEMASRLSFLLWGSMPDDELLARADAGQLETPEDIEDQARRMLEDPKARRMVEHFHEQWLGTVTLPTVDKDPAVFPDWSEAIAADQAAEARAFVDHVFFEGSGTLRELLTAPFTVVNDDLAEFYGMESPGAEPWGRVEAASGRERSGILSLGGVLSVLAQPGHTDPIRRGLFVRSQLLCQLPPPPPPDVVIPEIRDDAPLREQLEQHRSDPACRACHQLFDPIGFGFEHYDALGRWRATDSGQPIDASGEIVQADVEGTFDGVAALGERLASSREVAQCMSRQWFRYAYGRSEAGEVDACTLDTLLTRFEQSDYDLAELVVGLTQTDAFLYRSANAPEGARP